MKTKAKTNPKKSSVVLKDLKARKNPKGGGAITTVGGRGAIGGPLRATTIKYTGDEVDEQ